MTTQKITNIKLSEFERFLSDCGCRLVSTNGGHRKWEKEGLARPVILQSHIDPVPAFIIKNTLRNLGLTTKDYFRLK